MYLALYLSTFEQLIHKQVSASRKLSTDVDAVSTAASVELRSPVTTTLRPEGSTDEWCGTACSTDACNGSSLRF